MYFHEWRKRKVLEGVDENYFPLQMRKVRNVFIQSKQKQDVNRISVWPTASGTVGWELLFEKTLLFASSTETSVNQLEIILAKMRGFLQWIIPINNFPVIVFLVYMDWDPMKRSRAWVHSKGYHDPCRNAEWVGCSRNN